MTCQQIKNHIIFSLSEFSSASIVFQQCHLKKWYGCYASTAVTKCICIVHGFY